DHADRGPALRADAPHLAGGQRDLRPLAFTGGQRGGGAGAAADLPTAARLDLRVVDGHAQRHAPQRPAIADFTFHFLAADDAVAGLEPFGRQDVRLRAVLVLQQGDTCRAVGVVLDGDDIGPGAILAPLEVDDPVHALVAAAAEARADDALVVAAA